MLKILELFMGRKKKIPKVVQIDPNRMYIKKNGEGDYSICGSNQGVVVNIRFTDELDWYTLNGVQEILEMMQKL